MENKHRYIFFYTLSSCWLFSSTSCKNSGNINIASLEPVYLPLEVLNLWFSSEYKKLFNLLDGEKHVGDIIYTMLNILVRGMQTEYEYIVYEFKNFTDTLITK